MPLLFSGCQRDLTTEALLDATGKLVVGVDICRGKEDGKAKALAKGTKGTIGSGGNMGKLNAELRFVRGGVGVGSLEEVLAMGDVQVTIAYVDLTVTCGNDMLFDGIALVQNLLLSFKSR